MTWRNPEVILEENLCQKSNPWKGFVNEFNKRFVNEFEKDLWMSLIYLLVKLKA